jgi:beta-galactosidase/beta-glucuronidase
MNSKIEIFLGDVTDMEAHVFARYVGPESVELTGTLRGPFCEIAKTLPADFPFRKTNSQGPAGVEALVTEPCLWSAEMPQLYQVDLKATHNGQTIAEYHGTIGLERLAPRRHVDFAPGTG